MIMSLMLRQSALIHKKASMGRAFNYERAPYNTQTSTALEDVPLNLHNTGKVVLHKYPTIKTILLFSNHLVALHKWLATPSHPFRKNMVLTSYKYVAS